MDNDNGHLKEEMPTPQARTPVDPILSAVPGQWRFDREVSKAFDSHVRRSVPGYEDVQWLVAELSEYALGDGCKVVDIGCSTGETLHRLSHRHKNKQGLQWVGIEQSPTMVEQARSKLGDLPQLQLRCEQAQNSEAYSGAHLVTALYTLHFLPLGDRRSLLKRLAQEMAPGGMLLLVEKVLSEHTHHASAWTELAWDFKRSSGLSDEMILAKARSLRGVLSPLKPSELFVMLQQAGFTKVEPFYQWLGWAGYVAQAPA
jgi:tRNA (cmo5U34)-methyltransferase